MTDPVNNPAHYCGHPSGIECIQVTRHLSFNRGNAFKYIFRHRDKGRIVNPNEYRRQALRKILDATPETWESLCYLSLCTAGTFALKTAEQGGFRAGWEREEL
jgi:hypothetical protein